MTLKGASNKGFAWLTAPGSAALALLWLGRATAEQFFDSPLTARHRRFLWRDQQGQTIDEVLGWSMGDGFVLSMHGGPATRHAAEQALAAAGACQVPVPNLWEASDPLAVAALESLPQVQGELGVQLVTACATSGHSALHHACGLGDSELHRLVQAWCEASFLYTPPRVQLWGPVNAGKSSLLNALSGDTVAAEGPEPGLTRDVIEARVEHQGFVLRLFDAPGTGHDESPLNVAAAQLAERWRREADLTLELVPPGATASGTGRLLVYSRADEDPAVRKPGVSVRNAASLVALKQTLVSHFISRLLALPESLRVALPPAMLARLASATDPRAVIVP